MLAAVALAALRIGLAQDATVDGAALDDAALDGGADAAIPCGAVTWIGECQGDVEYYCASGQLRSIDCAATFGSDRTCGLWDCATTGVDDRGQPLCTGYYCVARRGTACSLNLHCDVATGQGCLGGVCADSLACDPASFQRRCDGTVVTYCSYTVSDLDCSSGGSQPYICGVTSLGSIACLGVEGAPCGSANDAECARSFACRGQHCQPVVVPDAAAADSAPGRDIAVAHDSAIVRDGTVVGDSAVVGDGAIGRDLAVPADAATPDRWTMPDAATGHDVATGSDTATIRDGTPADRMSSDRASGSDRGHLDGAVAGDTAPTYVTPQLIDSDTGCGCRQSAAGALWSMLVGGMLAWRLRHRPRRR